LVPVTRRPAYEAACSDRFCLRVAGGAFLRSEWTDSRGNLVGVRMRGLRFATLVVALLFEGVAAGIAQTADEIDRLRRQAEQLFNQRKHAEALATQRIVAAGTGQREAARHGAPGKEAAGALGDLARKALFARMPAEALEASERALALGPAPHQLLLIETHRAHALLLLGRTGEARKLYLAHKGRRRSPETDTTWEDAVAEDFDALRAAGIAYKEFPRIVAELGVKRPELFARIVAARKKVEQLLNDEKYQKAAAAAETLVALARQRYGEERTEFASALSWLAFTKQGLKKKEEAESLHKRSLAIREKALGPDNPGVVEGLTNLARIYQNDRRFEEAEFLLRRGLAIVETARGWRDHPDVLAVREELAALARNQGFNGQLARLMGSQAEAETLLKRSLAIIEDALGPEHTDVATQLYDLAEFYRSEGRLADAAPLMERCLAIVEKRPGSGRPELDEVLGSLAMLYMNQSRFDAAELLLKRNLVIAAKEKGEGEAVAQRLSRLAALAQARGRYAEAEQHYKLSLALIEKAPEPNDDALAYLLIELAGLHQQQGRYTEAETLLKRSLAVIEKRTGIADRRLARVLHALGGLYWNQGRYAEAEGLLLRSLATAERALGPEHDGDHNNVATVLNTLANLYQDLGRYPEAESLFKRALAIHEKTLGLDHPEVGTVLNNMAGLYIAMGQFDEVERLISRSLAIYEKALGPDHPELVTFLNNMGSVYRDQGRFEEAEPLFKRNLAIAEKAMGPEHRRVAMPLNNLGILYHMQGRIVAAEPLFKRSLAIVEKVLGPDHPDVNIALNNLAVLGLEQGDWTQAAEYWRRGTGVTERRARRGVDGGAGGSSKGEARRLRYQFEGLVGVTHRLAQGPDRASLAAEMFEAAQWAQASDAAASLAQMAARSATGSSRLGALVRERQDLASEWQLNNKLLIAAKGEAKRKPDAEKAFADRLAAIDARVAEIDRGLAQDFPDYAELARPLPLSVSEVQSQLEAGEALVLFLDAKEWISNAPGRAKLLPDESFVWVVTKSEVRWVRSELGTRALLGEVAALRCGLDNALWDDVRTSELCARLVGANRADVRPNANVLPFDLARAHALYKALFGRVEDLIAGRHLLVVASGALTQLPFQVLVTAASETGIPDGPAGYRDAAWLGVRQPITVLPAVSSLKALRAHARASRAGKAYLGIGNPLLDGPNAQYADLARYAREKQSCPVASQLQVAALARSGIARVETRRGLADVALIKCQMPLPETADELCAVAADLKAEVREVRLGAKATESEIKQLNESGELARYRVLHLATHGVMAGELDKEREPGLILTPPETASEVDDGYLSASEIAGLKLNADWVILSACNTAAGGATSAEALSGLARAFIYSGARALLVSHWAVYSEATVKLVTGAAREIANDPHVGRAEAMRRAMRALIEKGAPIEAHPSYWAPFIVVGEGAAVRQR
jgi:tetratricopeptide (TPR) repeat protein/CHAT domain-containing protein